MYTEQDLTDITLQAKKRRLALYIPCCIALAAILVLFILFRIPEWITSASTILVLGILVFCQELLIRPLKAYRNHIDHALHGRTRSMTAAFKSADHEKVTRDQVVFYPVMFSVGSLEEEEDDRLFYYDANLSLPDWHTGQMYELNFYDKFICSWKAA